MLDLLGNAFLNNRTDAVRPSANEERVDWGQMGNGMKRLSACIVSLCERDAH